MSAGTMFVAFTEQFDRVHGMDMSNTRFPKQAVWTVVLVCALPFVLNLLGFDFGTTRPKPNLQAISNLPAPMQDDALVYYLAGNFTYTILEWSAFCTAIITVLLAFFHYKLKSDVAIPIIAVALFCSGLMDAFYTLAADRLIVAVADNENLVPFTWAISRLFNALIMIIGADIYLISPKTNAAGHRGPVLVISLLFGFIAFEVMRICAISSQLPQTMFPDSFIHRPFDVLPLILFIFAGAHVFPRLYRRAPSVFSYALIVSALPQVVAQLHVVFGSTALFDNHFNIAQFLKIVAYLVLLYGLALDYIRVYRDRESEIVERKRKEEELDRFFTLSLDMLCIIGTDERFRKLNPSWEDCLGFTLNELKAVSWIEFVHPDDRAATRSAMSSMTETDVAYFENRCLHRSGGYRWLSWHATRWVDGVAYGVAHDVTQLKEAERSLKDAKEAADAAARAKSEFLANMSHEIRTPMTAILGFTDVLLEDGDIQRAPPERINDLRTVKRNGEFLLEIINDILDLSKIEAGKLEVERVRYSPAQIVADVASLMRVRADSKGLPLEVDFKGPIPETIETDPTRLRQILINLIGNAIKFTEVGKIQLQVHLIDDDPHGSMIQFDVVDTGIGMAPEQVSKLFRPFTQMDASMTRRFGGTGLGLTISKRLAEILGGGIAVLTSPGKGSTFSLSVDAGSLENIQYLQEPTESTLPEPPAPSVPLPAPPELDCRILLAEDGPDNQRLISFQLKRAGASVVVAENGKVAVDLAMAAQQRGEPFHLILMDMQMPVLDGYEATRLLRRRKYTGTIIALTAHAMAEDRDKCLRAGCDDYAAKPINRKNLFGMIKKYMDQNAALAGGHVKS